MIWDGNVEIAHQVSETYLGFIGNQVSPRADVSAPTKMQAGIVGGREWSARLAFRIIPHLKEPVTIKYLRVLIELLVFQDWGVSRVDNSALGDMKTVGKGERFHR